MNTLELQFFLPSQGGGSVLYTSKSKFGIREVTSTVFETRKGKHARQFYINGKKILIKGGGYTPDLLQRRSLAKYETEFTYMKDMGLNAVRLEGKMENDDFYRIADEKGILVMVGWCCCGSWQ
jgi:exo-1,4-beta-D-glucosaminidase